MTVEKKTVGRRTRSAAPTKNAEKKRAMKRPMRRQVTRDETRTLIEKMVKTRRGPPVKAR